MRASHDFRFDASSPVGRHWLIHGVGFTVCDSGGQKLGIVEDIDVDPLQHRAARVLVRRRGLFPRPRYVAIDSAAVESVLPGPRLFFVAAAEKGVPPVSNAAATKRVRLIAGSARAGTVAFARASRPVVSELDRRLAVAVAVTLRQSRRGSSKSAEAVAGAAARARRETPRLVAWLAARALEAAGAAVEVLRFMATAARGAARLLADLAVLITVLVVAAWRRGVARMQLARTPRERGASAPPDPDASSRRRDADAPLARETKSGTSMRPTGRRRPDGARSERPARRR